MQLYLLRHGIADDGRLGHPDAERALTAEGKKKLRSVLKWARDADLAPTLIVTSPYRRAMETAQLAATILGYERDLVRSEALIPSARPEAAWDEIRIFKDEPQILLSGHDPLFSNLLGFLLCCPSLQVDFKKGAMVRVDLERFGPQPRGMLKWMLVPKLAK